MTAQRLLLTMILSLVPSAVLAGPVLPCVPGTLVDYFSMDSEGCSIGDKQFFDFFEWVIPHGASLIDPATVTVLPSGTLSGASLEFQVNQSAAAGQFLDISFIYSVRVPATGAAIDGLKLRMTGALAAGDGTATVIKDSCFSDFFFPDFCDAASAPPLITIATDFFTETGQATRFAPQFVMGIFEDIGIDGGSVGFAALGSAVNEFANVPEPASWLLVSAGLAVVWRLGRRRSRSEAPAPDHR